MLQIDHIYEFLYKTIFANMEVWYCLNGVTTPDASNIQVFTPSYRPGRKIFFYDQEPFVPKLAEPYLKTFTVDPGQGILATSEYSLDVDACATINNFSKLYYFFHGFAAQDWYRGYYALNYHKPVIKDYFKDFISYNRIITNDRSYRIYFISQLVEQGLLDQGAISFGVTDNDDSTWQDEVADPNTKLNESAKLHIEKHLTGIHKLVLDSSHVHGSASANILRNINTWLDPNLIQPTSLDAFWHIVTETVFYYDKLHLTEKIFKPIVSKQPFMLLAAPGNLEYLKSYGFKTFDHIIDESYDTIQDPNARIQAVVSQLNAYCNLSSRDKMDMIYALEPVIEYNFRHFYTDFKHIIANELLTNIKTLFQEIEYNERIPYSDIYHVLTH